MAQLQASPLRPRIRIPPEAVSPGLAAVLGLLLAGTAPPVSDRPLVRRVIQRADRARLAPVGVWPLRRAIVPARRELGLPACWILAARLAHLGIAAIRPSRMRRAIGAVGFSIGPGGRWPRSQLAPAGIVSLAPVAAAISPAAAVRPAIIGTAAITPARISPARIGQVIVGTAFIRRAAAIGPAVVGTAVAGTAAARASGAASGFRRLRRPTPAPWGSGLPRLRPDRRVTVSRCQGVGPDRPKLA
jgi:hypothetical protein